MVQSLRCRLRATGTLKRAFGVAAVDELVERTEKERFFREALENALLPDRHRARAIALAASLRRLAADFGALVDLVPVNDYQRIGLCGYLLGANFDDDGEDEAAPAPQPRDGATV